MGYFASPSPGFSYSKLTTRKSYRRKMKIGLARGLVEKAQIAYCGRETERERGGSDLHDSHNLAGGVIAPPA